jgi:hypothetical protein
VRRDSSEGEGVRRIGRHILNWLTVLSLVLCVASIVTWTRSFRWVEGVTFLRQHEGGEPWRSITAVGTLGGFVGLHCFEDHPGATRTASAGYQKERFDGREFQQLLDHLAGPGSVWHGGRRWGVYYCWFDEPYGPWSRGLTYRDTFVLVPCWMLVVLFAALPAARFAWARRRRLRDERGLCPSCGYDLRATPDRCPECGAIPAKVKA